MKEYKKKYYVRELKGAKQWMIISFLLFVATFYFYFYPYLTSNSSSYIDWLVAESSRHFARYWADEVFNPIIMVISLAYFIYGITRYFYLKRKLKKEK